MKKNLIFILLLFATITCSYAQNQNDDLLHQGAAHHKAKTEQKLQKDRNNYWIGKVPIQDGLVTFQKTFSAPNKNKSELFKIMTIFSENLVSASGHKDISQIAYKNESQGMIIVNISETMYFVKRAWEADFTDFYYHLTIICSNNSLTVKFNNLSYKYEEGREEGWAYLKAEDWITDDKAFNKSKTKFINEPGKFRRNTIDRINVLFKQISNIIATK